MPLTNSQIVFWTIWDYQGKYQEPASFNLFCNLEKPYKNCYQSGRLPGVDPPGWMDIVHTSRACSTSSLSSAFSSLLSPSCTNKCLPPWPWRSKPVCRQQSLTFLFDVFSAFKHDTIALISSVAICWTLRLPCWGLRFLFWSADSLAIQYREASPNLTWTVARYGNIDGYRKANFHEPVRHKFSFGKKGPWFWSSKFQAFLLWQRVSTDESSARSPLIIEIPSQARQLHWIIESCLSGTWTVYMYLNLHISACQDLLTFKMQMTSQLFSIPSLGIDSRWPLKVMYCIRCWHLQVEKAPIYESFGWSDGLF